MLPQNIPEKAPQFQPDDSFISEQNLVLSSALAALYLVGPDAWREEVSNMCVGLTETLQSRGF